MRQVGAVPGTEHRAPKGTTSSPMGEVTGPCSSPKEDAGEPPLVCLGGRSAAPQSATCHRDTMASPYLGIAGTSGLLVLYGNQRPDTPPPAEEVSMSATTADTKKEALLQELRDRVARVARTGEVPKMMVVEHGEGGYKSVRFDGSKRYFHVVTSGSRRP